MSPISSISALAPAAIAPAPAQPAAAPGAFQDLLQNAITKVEQDRTTSKQAVEKFLSGESEDLHGVALSAQRAELSSELFLQVRNKIVQAYQEIMRMQM